MALQLKNFTAISLYQHSTSIYNGREATHITPTCNLT